MSMGVVLSWARILSFFLQAEGGIRDWSVTGVQTCAPPISSGKRCAAVASDLAADPGRRLLYGEAARDTARSGRARSAAPSPRTRSHIFRRAAGTLE